MSSAATIPRRRRLSTPGTLWLWLGAIVISAIMAAAISLGAAKATADAARTVGRDAEPSVALGLRIASTLSEMDSEALGDSLTDNGKAVGTSARFRRDEAQLADETTEAARNVTYGELEAAPLRRLQRAIQLYIEAVAEARGTKAGADWLFAQRLKWASRVDRDFAIPEALALANANADQLERVYDGYRSSAWLQISGVALGFGLLIACLIGSQVWLADRVHRILNPLLMAATLVAGIGAVWVVSAITTERADLRAAKSDAYDSLHVLFQAESSAHALRADVSLWLLEPDSRTEASAAIEREFGALATADLRRPEVAGPLRRDLAAALALENSQEPKESAARTPHIGGLLGKELDNITFGAAERTPATESVIWLVDFAGIIAAVESAELRGDHSQAVDHWLSEHPGGGGEAMRSLIASLDGTIAVNQTAFDRHSDAAVASMKVTPWVVGASLTLACALSLAGLWPRLNEYR